MISAKYLNNEQEEEKEFDPYYNKVTFCDYYHKYDPIGFATPKPVSWRYDKNEISSIERVLFELNDEYFSLPIELLHIRNAIVKSKGILDLEDDWDGDGARAVDKTTWLLAARILIEYSIATKKDFSVVISEPEINPTHNGGLDIVWKTANARLLINILPAGSNATLIGSFYGDLYSDGQIIKGLMKDEVVINHLAFWMKYLSK